MSDEFKDLVLRQLLGDYAAIRLGFKGSIVRRSLFRYALMDDHIIKLKWSPYFDGGHFAEAREIIMCVLMALARCGIPTEIVIWEIIPRMIAVHLDIDSLICSPTEYPTLDHPTANDGIHIAVAGVSFPNLCAVGGWVPGDRKHVCHMCRADISMNPNTIIYVSRVSQAPSHRIHFSDGTLLSTRAGSS